MRHSTCTIFLRSAPTRHALPVCHSNVSNSAFELSALTANAEFGFVCVRVQNSARHTMRVPTCEFIYRDTCMKQRQWIVTAGPNKQPTTTMLQKSRWCGPFVCVPLLPTPPTRANNACQFSPAFSSNAAQNYLFIHHFSLSTSLLCPLLGPTGNSWPLTADRRTENSKKNEIEEMKNPKTGEATDLMTIDRVLTSTIRWTMFCLVVSMLFSNNIVTKDAKLIVVGPEWSIEVASSSGIALPREGWKWRQIWVYQAIFQFISTAPSSDMYRGNMYLKPHFRLYCEDLFQTSSEKKISLA